jgi:hypothetical protein
MTHVVGQVGNLQADCRNGNQKRRPERPPQATGLPHKKILTSRHTLQVQA